MTSPLRIVHIVPSISLVYGGPSQMVRGLAAAQAAAGAEVTILTTNANGDRGQAPLDVPLNQPIPEAGYHVRYFRCAPFRRYKFSLDLLTWLAAHAQDFDIAHIHALFSPISTAAATVARSRRLPYLLRPLGTLDPADLRKKRWLKQIYGRLLERPNLAGAAAVHFTSDQEAKISERFGAQTRDWVIPLGVSLPEPETAPSPEAMRAKYGLPGDRPLVLFMSRLDPKKGLELLIPALEAIAAEGLPFHWVVAGANPQDPAYEAQICAQIQQSAIAPHTTLTGFVTGPDKLGLLRAADLFVLPSYYENFGIAVAEAMAMGIPVVISDQVHIWPAVQQAGAGWITPCTVPDLIANLKSALDPAANRAERGRQGQLYAQKIYSWSAIARQTLDAYRTLLQKG